MGGKPERQRQHILLFSAACLILLMMAGGCRSAGGEPLRFPEKESRSADTTAKTIEPENALAQEPDQSWMSGRIAPPTAQNAPTPLDRLESQWLDRAATAMQGGNSANALASIDKAVTCCNGRFADRAVRLLTGLLARPGVAANHRSQAIQCFLQLEANRPEAVYGAAARCWASALDEVLAREADIQKLRKTIQLQKRQIQILEKQIEQLKAVDLELETPQPNLNVP
jgi:hypothetical protein